MRIFGQTDGQIMADIGKWNTLVVLKELDFGVYLDGGEHGEILMPIRYVPTDCKIGDKVEVFIYLDSEDRLIATTEKPFAQVGDFVLLEVVSRKWCRSFPILGVDERLIRPI